MGLGVGVGVGALLVTVVRVRGRVRGVMGEEPLARPTRALGDGTTTQ